MKTGQEILEIIEENYSESNFAYGEWLEVRGGLGDFQCSKDLEEVEKLYDERRTAYQNHPGYRDSNKRDENYDKIQEEYFNAPRPYDLKAEEFLKYLGLGQVENVEQVGGEGEGDHWHQVWYFKDHDVYIKITGDYSSYNGTDFYNGYGSEVKPVEKTITVFQ